MGSDVVAQFARLRSDGVSDGAESEGQSDAMGSRAEYIVRVVCQELLDQSLPDHKLSNRKMYQTLDRKIYQRWWDRKLNTMGSDLTVDLTMCRLDQILAWRWLLVACILGHMSVRGCIHLEFRDCVP